LLAALVAAEAYPEHSTMAKLKITRVFMAERTGSPQKKMFLANPCQFRAQAFPAFHCIRTSSHVWMLGRHKIVVQLGITEV